MLQRRGAYVVIVAACHTLIGGNHYISRILMLVMLALQKFMRNAGHIYKNVLNSPARMPEIYVRALIKPHGLPYTARAYKIHCSCKLYCAVYRFKTIFYIVYALHIITPRARPAARL